ncbi:hypothetical protein EGW08_002154, partial [Elysia chlorotica]
DGLHTASNNCYQIKETLKIVTIDPVQDVQTSSKQIVRSNSLCFSCLAHHEQLRKNGYRLQVDREGPENLQHNHLKI